MWIQAHRCLTILSSVSVKDVGHFALIFSQIIFLLTPSLAPLIYIGAIFVRTWWSLKWVQIHFQSNLIFWVFSFEVFPDTSQGYLGGLPLQGEVLSTKRGGPKIGEKGFFAAPKAPRKNFEHFFRNVKSFVHFFQNFWDIC